MLALKSLLKLPLVFHFLYYMFVCLFTVFPNRLQAECNGRYNILPLNTLIFKALNTCLLKSGQHNLFCLGYHNYIASYFSAGSLTRSFFSLSLSTSLLSHYSNCKYYNFLFSNHWMAPQGKKKSNSSIIFQASIILV